MDDTLKSRVGQSVTDGSWTVIVRDDTGATIKTFTGDILSSLTSAGTIEVEDSDIDDGNGGTRSRTLSDEYAGSYLDVGMMASALPPLPTQKEFKYLRSAISHRPQTRLSALVEAPGIIPIGGTRTAMDGMMDESMLGMASLSHHFDLQQMGVFDGISGGAEEWYWSLLSPAQGWINVNKLLAGAVPGQIPTHFFVFAHGNPTGFGMLRGSGETTHVDVTTLTQEGYWEVRTEPVHFTFPDGSDGGWSTVKVYTKRSGLSFCFIDGCSAAPFLPVLMINNVHTSGFWTTKNEPTLSDLIKSGKFPYYGCGWTTTKAVSWINGLDVDLGHSDYVTSFFAYCVDRDPSTGFLKLDYKDAREKARHWSIPPGYSNLTANWGWKHIGCDELFMDN
jgi:hypothetical protein